MDYDYDLNAEGMEDDYYPDFYPDNEVLSEEDRLSPWNDQGGLPPMSFSQLLSTCVQPTLLDGFDHAWKALAWCLIYRLTTQTIYLPQQIAHIASITCGSVLMHHFFGTNLIYLLCQGIIAYLSLSLTSKVLKRKSGWICFATCISFLLTCEIYIVQPTQWHMIRAVQMLVAMRAISVGFQLDDTSLPSLPQPLPYFGYLYHVGTVSFGPWVSFKDYIALLQSPPLFSTSQQNPKSNGAKANSRSLFYSALKIAWSLLLSMIFLTVSTCWIHWLIPSGSSKWFLAYRDALSFRCSHYFVSYLSEATALSSGMDTSSSAQWPSVTVTSPLQIEFPRSLVEVVINWNVPMHTWLKTYVFRVARPYGTFVAVLGTYAVSALLHGLNFQLAAVLLSLGFYTYTEHVTRQKLAAVFSACIQARKCGSQCGHRYKEGHWAVRLTNVSLSLLAVFHLAYLGLMFDSSKIQEEGYSFYHTLSKWRWLHYSSHWITLGTFIFYLLI